ncbi:uncharacterized protein LOC110451300 [Mizuhopecten yessoensis]|uniref:uncharacterized protein LOC110451300 n=1 Tax=Mizuhopecten yessoensis TaxID=6573 RepID=UPI000B458B84|nr:uncharacterized protein LOC110451300 [Mizuhopecten yessoensis]
MYPCPFYSPQNNHGSRSLYSSDSELDSDSGYSSPLHKRSQVSSVGTQPAEFIQTMFFTPNSADSEHCISNSNQSGQRQYVSKSTPSGNSISNSGQSGQNTLNSLRPGQTQSIQNSVQSEQSNAVTPAAVSQQKMSYAMIAQKVPSPKPSVQPQNTQSANVCDISSNCERSRTVSGEITPSAKKSVTSTYSSKSVEKADESKNRENVGESEALPGEKKKRKRNRKRTKKMINDDSNISHAVEDVELHFEDEEEFPDLLGSVQTRSPSRERTSSLGREKTLSSRETTLSREQNHFIDSDSMALDNIQKSDRTAHVLHPSGGNMSNLRETTINKSMEYSSSSPVAMTTTSSMSGPPSYSSILKAKKHVVTFDETQLQQNERLLKESKAREVTESAESRVSRKRRKRREMMNQAAEEELAEIGLEQDMLRELNLKPAAAKKTGSEGGPKGDNKC